MGMLNIRGAGSLILGEGGFYGCTRGMKEQYCLRGGHLAFGVQVYGPPGFQPLK